MTYKKTMVGRVRLEVDIEGFELYEQEIIGYLLHGIDWIHYKWNQEYHMDTWRVTSLVPIPYVCTLMRLGLVCLETQATLIAS